MAASYQPMPQNLNEPSETDVEGGSHGVRQFRVDTKHLLLQPEEECSTGSMFTMPIWAKAVGSLLFLVGLGAAFVLIRQAPKGSAPHGLQAPESNTIEAVMPSEQMLKAMQRLQDQATKMAQTRSTEENAASTATDETSPKATNAPHPHATADATHEPAHVTNAPAHVTHAPAVAKHAEHSEPAKHKHNSTIGTNSTNGKNTSDSEDSTPCHSALPGEPCYEAVLWHKWVGVVENPSWYKTISRQSNRHDIQKWLWESKQGQCQRPCAGSYPVPQQPKGKTPQIYCFSVSRGGAEMDTMFLQRQVGGGIFGCDGFDVFSDQAIDIDGYKTKVIPSTVSGVSVDGTAANSQVFLKTWMAILTDDKWWHYDFIAKVDPDAILYAERLRGHLQWHVGQDVFFLNCAKYIPATMYGALEVFSKAALGAYLSQHERCEHSLPFWSWGEDRYMAGCLEMLGVQTLPDYMNFLHDERCWGVDCGNKAAVAFHSFKQVNHWYRCYESSK